MTHDTLASLIPDAPTATLPVIGRIAVLPLLGSNQDSPDPESQAPHDTARHTGSDNDLARGVTTRNDPKRHTLSRRSHDNSHDTRAPGIDPRTAIGAVAA